MARRSKSTFDSLHHAAAEGTAADVQTLLAAGTPVDDREERDDETPLMAAAVRGNLATARALVDAGADVNHVSDGMQLDVAFPFLDELGDTVVWTSPAGYAALYGRAPVYDLLAPLSNAEVRAGAEAVYRARQAYLDSLDDEERAEFLQSLEPAPPKKRAAARAALLKDRKGLARWIVTCGLCQRQGYKPTMPVEIDRRGTAAQARRLFAPLPLKDYVCERCAARLEKKKRELEAKLQQPRPRR